MATFQDRADGAAVALSELYSSIVGLAEGSCKLPLRVARDLEERFIRDGWPVGRVYGNESDLAAGFGVGRDVAREAVRILQARGSVRTLRGRRGGVALSRPRGAQLADAVADHAYLTGTTAVEILEAWAAVHAAAVRLLSGQPGDAWTGAEPATGSEAAAWLREWAAGLIERSGNATLACLARLLIPLLPPARGTGSVERVAERAKRIQDDLREGRTRTAVRETRGLFLDTEKHNLSVAQRTNGPGAVPPSPSSSVNAMTALDVVHTLMRQVTPAEWSRGVRLGHEAELCDRLFADRSVIRQAARIMEDEGTAVTLPGRGGGLVTRRPDSVSLSRRLCAVLASGEAELPDTERALQALMVEMVTLAASNRRSEDETLIDSLHARLRQLRRAGPLAAIQPVERLLYQLAHNDLLLVFVDGLKAYLTWSMAEEASVPSWIMEVYAETTGAVLHAVARNDVEEAELRQEEKQERLERCRRLFLEGQHSSRAASS
ncbi:FCD domain-containing protein [Streptomyces sp. NPDC058464]|uniref:FCD domain-containing protein n=1 Tax=Streptomyces sp. NPDC058464 TaxID=3346511 RepID=UPI0036537F22